MNTIIRNISFTFIANTIALAVSFFLILCMPRFMDITEYGYWQLYLFYISYAGLLHFGLCDGICLRYAGKEYNELDKDLVRGQFFVLVIFLFAICSLISFFCYFFFLTDVNTRKIILLACIGAIFHVLKTYLLLILQSTNRVKEYSVITASDRIAFLVLVFVFLYKGLSSFEQIILCDILSRFVSLVVAVCWTKDIVIGRFLTFLGIKQELFQNIASGGQLLLSGIASNLIIGVVRYEIKLKQSIEEFGKVSLALSVINMILSFINMVSIVFFPILKRFDFEAQGKSYKSMALLLATITFGVLCLSGVVRNIVSFWLPQYVDSMTYMILLLPSCVFEGETLLLLNTYMKVLRKEKELLVINFSVMCLAIIFSLFLYLTDVDFAVSLICMNVLLLIRCFVLKRIVYKQFKLGGYLKKVLTEFFLVFSYLFLFLNCSLVFANIIYIIVFLIYVLIQKTNIRFAFLYFRKNN